MTPQEAYWFEITKIFLTLTILIVVVYDSLVMFFHGRQPTISDVAYHYAREWPIVPLMVGMIIGHMFWK